MLCAHKKAICIHRYKYDSKRHIQCANTTYVFIYGTAAKETGKYNSILNGAQWSVVFMQQARFPFNWLCFCIAVNNHLHLHRWYWGIGNTISNAPSINGLAIGFQALNKRNSRYMYVCVLLILRLDNLTYIRFKKNGSSLTMGNKLLAAYEFHQNFLFHNSRKTYRKSKTLPFQCVNCYTVRKYVLDWRSSIKKIKKYYYDSLGKIFGAGKQCAILSTHSAYCWLLITKWNSGRTSLNESNLLFDGKKTKWCFSDLLFLLSTIFSINC